MMVFYSTGTSSIVTQMPWTQLSRAFPLKLLEEASLHKDDKNEPDALQMLGIRS